MSDLENKRAQAEAMNQSVSRALRSARRSQLWAGLNRYLASEAEHATKVARAEKEAARSEKAGRHAPSAEREEKVAGEPDDADDSAPGAG